MSYLGEIGNTCQDYAEDCSDTYHQGELTCHPGGPKGFTCGYSTPGETGGVTLQSKGVELWNPDETVASMTLVRAALLDGREVVIDEEIGGYLIAGWSTRPSAPSPWAGTT